MQQLATNDQFVAAASLDGAQVPPLPVGARGSVIPVSPAPSALLLLNSMPFEPLRCQRHDTTPAPRL
jgi:hypothetical protein